jgi:hypothetical protein
VNREHEAQAALPEAIDRATLTPPVQSALDSRTAEVVDWEMEQLHAGIGAGTGVYRFSGQGRDRDRTIPWSLILKTLSPAGGSDDVSAWNYYKREADAYRSEWFDDLPGGLAAPRCYGVVEHPDGTCLLWLEDVRDRFDSQWPLEHYGVVARHLGQFNGAYLAGRPQPEWSWLSSKWIRKYVESSAPAMEPLRNSLAHPLIGRWFPGDDSDRFFRLWAERELYLGALECLPQTICHFDFFRRNLFARRTGSGADQTAAVDWAFMGRGPIGADIHPLIFASVLFSEVGLDRVQELEEIVFENYLEGLRDAGWQGDPRQVRLGYTAAQIRYAFAEIGRWLTVIHDESLIARMEQVMGLPVGEIFDGVVQVRHAFARLTDEARELMDILKA